MSTKKNIIPVAGSNKEVLSREQKFFNSRVKKINKLKTEVEKLEGFMKEIRQKKAEWVQPVEDSLLEARIELVKLLDQAHSSKFFKKKEKEKLAEMTKLKSLELIGSFGATELIPIFDKYSDRPYEEMAKEEEEEFKASFATMAKESFGVDIDLDDIDDFSNEEEVMAKIFAKIGGKREEIDAFMKEQQSGNKGNKKKTKAQLAREQKQEEELKNVSKAAKAIYTDLVKMYHPDRETDEAKREEKTQIMQRITIAYKEDDLYELLRLKIELMGDSEDLGDIPETQIKFYNKLLLDQVKELEATKYALKNPPPPYDYFAEYMNSRSLKTLHKKIREEQYEVEYELEDAQGMIEDALNNEVLRMMISNYILEKDRPQFDPNLLSMLLGQSMDDDDGWIDIR